MLFGKKPTESHARVVVLREGEYPKGIFSLVPYMLHKMLCIAPSIKQAVIICYDPSCTCIYLQAYGDALTNAKMLDEARHFQMFKEFSEEDIRKAQMPRRDDNV